MPQRPATLLMLMDALTFEITARADDCHARCGRIETPHGTIETPAFMPVGTRGAVKGLCPQQVRDTGAEMVLANTYHLMLRPGSALIAAMGGLQAWTRWAGPMLTDSGGYQVFSLSDISRINEEGVRFRSHIDGAMVELTPQRSMQVQNELGADIIMAFDDCPPAAAPTEHQQQRARAHQGAARPLEHPSPAASPQAGPHTTATPPRDPTPPPTGTAGVTMLDPASYRKRVREACERSARWLDRCIASHSRPGEQALFGIVQGGTDLGQRDWSLEATCGFELPGYAIGGVAVGEGHDGLKQVVEHCGPRLPANRPRYLMGVGYERDLLVAIRAGMDLFDCVLPTRNGRNGNAFTSTGQLRVRNAACARDPGPIDPGCDCPACGGGFSRSYLRHLLLSGEVLGPMLVSLHNLRHFQRYLLDIRAAIRDNNWSLLCDRWPVAVAGGCG